MNELKKTPVTAVLIGMNLIIFILVEATGGTDNISHMMACGAAYAPAISEQGEYYRLFTCMFLHFGLPHLLNNMLVLYFVGTYLERNMGWLRMLLIYLIGGMGASLVSYGLALRSGDYAVSAGASGAIFAVLGALIYMVIANRGHVEDMTIRKLLFMAVLSLYFGFTSSGVDNAAHVGGIVIGFLLSVVLYRRNKQ